MEITRPSVEASFGINGWMERRREEYRRTSVALRVVGGIGWSLLALTMVGWVR